MAKAFPGARFLILWQRSGDLEVVPGECLVPDPLPRGYVLFTGMNNCKRGVGPGRARLTSGCGAGGRKYIFHGVEAPCGTEEKWMREKGAGGGRGCAGKRNEKAKWG